MQVNGHQGNANIQQLNNQRALSPHSYQGMQEDYNNHYRSNASITEKQKDQWFGDEDGNIPVERQKLSTAFKYIKEAYANNENEGLKQDLEGAVDLIKDIYMGGV